MKAYSIDRGWMGGVVVFAESREAAAAVIATYRPYPWDDPPFDPDDIEEFEITAGSLIGFCGDT